MTEKKEEPFISKEEIGKETTKRIDMYYRLNFFEQYAMFMGKAQILELGLKKLLEEKYNYDLDLMEKWTLGRIAGELEKNNLRQDFIFLLKSVVDYRNYIAHELLVNQALLKGMFNHLIPDDHYDKESRILHKAIFELEQISFLFDWTQENNAWQ